MPICIKCGFNKPQYQFVFHKIKNKYENRCKDCKSEYGMEKNKEFRKRNQEYISNIKQNNPCEDCGNKFYPCQMDFNHIDPTTKLFELWKVSTRSLNAVKKEIGKCELICANCHRYKTQEKFGARCNNPTSCNKSYTDFINSLKDNKSYYDCRRVYPYFILDFDHIGNKSFELNLAKQRRMGKSIVIEEISKCELVCVNCHRLRTYNRGRFGVKM